MANNFANGESFLLEFFYDELRYVILDADDLVAYIIPYTKLKSTSFVFYVDSFN